MSVAADALHAARGALAADGYAIIDGAMEESVTDLLRAQMATLADAGALRPHVFGFRPSPSEPVAVYTKPHIFEAELGDAAVSACAPKLVAAVEALRLAPLCAEAFPDLDLEPNHATVKLQHNAGGGGCFPYHFDNAGPPSKRALTCLFYLNPDWSDGHGGELVLLPWLRPAVTIAPSVRRTPPAAHATPGERAGLGLNSRASLARSTGGSSSSDPTASFTACAPPPSRASASPSGSTRGPPTPTPTCACQRGSARARRCDRTLARRTSASQLRSASSRATSTPRSTPTPSSSATHAQSWDRRGRVPSCPRWHSRCSNLTRRT